MASFEPEDYIGRNLGLIYVQLLTHPDRYTYWYEEDKEPKIQELVRASILDASQRGSKLRQPLTGPWGVQTTFSSKFHALANVVLKGKQVIKDDPNMVPPFRGWHLETRMSEQAKKLISRVAEGESPQSVLGEDATPAQMERLKRDWSAIAKEPIEIEAIGGAFYGFGSELAVLRLFHKYCQGGGNPKARAGLSTNLHKWYFSLEHGL